MALRSWLERGVIPSALSISHGCNHKTACTITRSAEMGVFTPQGPCLLLPRWVNRQNQYLGFSEFKICCKPHAEISSYQIQTQHSARLGLWFINEFFWLLPCGPCAYSELVTVLILLMGFSEPTLRQGTFYQRYTCLQTALAAWGVVQSL